MTQEQEWFATVTLRRPGNLDDDQFDALTQALPGFGQVTDDGERLLRLSMTVRATTLRRATDTALSAARSAYTAALGLTGDMVAVTVMENAERVRELERPQELRLVGYGEIAERFGVSKQRVREIATTNPDFPDAVARLAMGPVYTEQSVAAFEARWERKRTGRPKEAQ